MRIIVLLSIFILHPSSFIPSAAAADLSRQTVRGSDPGLVGYWKLDDLGCRDFSGNAQHLSVSNSPIIDSGNGKVGSALLLNGMTQFAQTQSTSIGAYGTAGQTWAAWVKMASKTRTMAVIAKDTDAGTARAGALVVNSDGIFNHQDGWWTFGLYAANSSAFLISAVQSNVVPLGTWTHLCAVRTGVNTLALYRNGKLENATANYTDSPSVSGTQAITIGYRPYAGYNQYFFGSIDEVRIYNRALSAVEVAALYADTNPSFAFSPNQIPGLVIWVDAALGVHQGGGNTGINSTISGDGDPVGYCADLSGAGNYIDQLSDSAKPTYKTNILNGRPVVRFDSTLDISGHGDHLANGFNSSQPLTAFVVVKVRSLPASFAGILDGDNSGHQAGIGVDAVTGHYRFYTSVTNIDSSATVSTNSFKYISAIYNGTNSSMWVNGTLAATGDLGTEDVEGMVFACAVNEFFPLEGDIAEILYYNTAQGTADRQKLETYLAVKYGLPLPP